MDRFGHAFTQSVRTLALFSMALEGFDSNLRGESLA